MVGLGQVLRDRPALGDVAGTRRGLRYEPMGNMTRAQRGWGVVPA